MPIAILLIFYMWVLSLVAFVERSFSENMITATIMGLILTIALSGMLDLIIAL